MIPNAFSNKQLQAPSVLKRNHGENAVIFIPGGPCLSSKYMENACHLVTRLTGYNSYLTSIPNHDQLQNEAPHRRQNLYADILDIYQRAIEELGNSCRNLVVIGHSFGARVAFDLRSKFRLQKRVPNILVGFPHNFQASKAFNYRKIQIIQQPFTINSDESFQEYWRSILPLYFESNPSNEVVELLSAHVFWQGNSNITASAPDFEDSLHNSPDFGPIAFIDGVSDLRSVEHHGAWIRESFPDSRHILIMNAAHFPMLENPNSFSEEVSKLVHELTLGALA